MPRVGDLLDGRYELQAPIGAGGTATVFRARDLRLGRDVAVKILLPALAADPALAARFDEEARALATISHRAVVAVYDVAAGDPAKGREPYYVMELCDGGSLAAIVKTGRRLDPASLVPIVATIADGLAELHSRGLVHRDVKPSNVLLTSSGPRLADFGLARRELDPDLATGQSPIMGTLAYLAPEVLAGDPPTQDADVYALGVVAFLGLTGRPPNVAASIADLVGRTGEPPLKVSRAEPALGPSFDASVAAALDPNASDRPDPLTFAASMATALGAWTRSGRPGANGAATMPSRPDATSAAGGVGAAVAPVVSAVASPSRVAAAPSASLEAIEPSSATIVATEPTADVATTVAAGTPATAATARGVPAPGGRVRSVRGWLAVVAGIGAVLIVAAAMVGLVNSLRPSPGVAAAPSGSASPSGPTASPSASASPSSLPSFASPSPSPSSSPLPSSSPAVPAAITEALSGMRSAVAAAKGGPDGLRGRDANDLDRRIGTIGDAAKGDDLSTAAKRAHDLLDKVRDVAERQLSEARGAALVDAAQALVDAIAAAR